MGAEGLGLSSLTGALCIQAHKPSRDAQLRYSPGPRALSRWGRSLCLSVPRVEDSSTRLLEAERELRAARQRSVVLEQQLEKAQLEPGRAVARGRAGRDYSWSCAGGTGRTRRQGPGPPQAVIWVPLTTTLVPSSALALCPVCFGSQWPSGGGVGSVALGLGTAPPAPHCCPPTCPSPHCHTAAGGPGGPGTRARAVEETGVDLATPHCPSQSCSSRPLAT